MNPTQMLYEMCHSVLTNADIKAICKSRGFSDQETRTRSLFENVFLSSSGVEAAMSTLTPMEIAALHLLRQENRTVDVAFFERLYGSDKTGTRGYGTFTQQFKSIFSSVQTRLVRKGLLLIAEAKTNSPTKTKMELWRYHFPAEFGPALPSLFTNSIHTSETGSVKADPFRQELLGLQRQRRESQPVAAKLERGILLVEMHEFSVDAVQQWQQSRWEMDILRANLKASVGPVYQQSDIFLGYLLSEGDYRKPTPLPVVSYALEQLDADEWIASNQLDTLLDVFYASKSHPSSALICEQGYENGCLARYESDSRTYYRLPDARHLPVEVSPEHYLKASADGAMAIDVERIPYRDLETLNRSASLEVNHGQLTVIPNLLKLIEAPEAVHEQPLLRYLEAKSPAFKAVFKKFNAQWGRVIVHDNLLVARVTDLSLRVRLEKTFGGEETQAAQRVVFLPDDYIAFPRAMLGEVEKFVKKAGHVIKTVQTE